MVIGAEVWGSDERGFAVEGGRFSQVGGDIKGGEWEGYVALPGFIDSHCHVIPAGLDLLKLNLGECSSKEEVLAAVREWLPKVAPGQWLHATQYDQNKWGGHITRFELDEVSGGVPILLHHSNYHASVVNTAGLRAAGVADDVEDPAGGEYERNESGELTGVLLEKAHEAVITKIPEPGLEEMVEAIMRAGESMAEFGITSATDMMTGRWDLAKELTAYRIASERGCKVRLRMYLQWREVLGDRGIDPAELKELMGAMDDGVCKVLGLKVFADGAIGSATAAIHGKFVTTGRNGRLIYSETELHRIVAMIDAAGWSCSLHTIGDRSTDLVMDAFEKTTDPARHRIEHVTILSDGQVERLARLGSHVTLQPEFLYRFAKSYKSQLEPEYWPMMKRARSLIDGGLSMSFSSDRPIVVGDPWVGIYSSHCRPEGYGDVEATTIAEGVDLYTRGGAVANFDGDWLGRIESGFGGDFQIYEAEELAGFCGASPLQNSDTPSHPSLVERDGHVEFPKPVAVYRAGQQVV